MKAEKNSEVVVAKPKPDFSIEALMMAAVQSNGNVETMERLVALRSNMKAEYAKEAFNAAMAKFQSECPTIQKTKEVKTSSGATAYKYAPIESIVSQIKDALGRNGFSYSTNMELLAEGVKVMVKVTHIEGHSEVTDMTVPLGSKTNIMSQSQVVAAASTFAKRYAFLNAFGIMTGDEDTDASKETVEYDNPPVKPKAKVISTGDDDGTSKDPINMKKAEIKKICDDRALEPLITGDDYVRYVKENTGLDLKQADNKLLDMIIERLRSI